MNLNEHLAINVMGWEVTTTIAWLELGKQNYYTPDPDAKDSKRLRCVVDSWLPSENIEQAMSLLDGFDQTVIESWNGANKNRYHRVTVETETELKTGDMNKSLPMAISLVCAKATGWEE